MATLRELFKKDVENGLYTDSERDWQEFLANTMEKEQSNMKKMTFKRTVTIDLPMTLQARKDGWICKMKAGNIVGSKDYKFCRVGHKYDLVDIELDVDGEPEFIMYTADNMGTQTPHHMSYEFLAEHFDINF